MSAGQLRPLPETAKVFRLVPPIDGYYDAGRDKPHPTAFVLSTEDRKQNPQRLTVWDVARTTVKQARRIHGNPDTKAFALDVLKIRQVGNERLDVVEDPLPSNSGTGADGHCGITGLHRISGEPKVERQYLRSRLADIAAPYHDNPGGG